MDLILWRHADAESGIPDEEPARAGAPGHADTEWPGPLDGVAWLRAAPRGSIVGGGRDGGHDPSGHRASAVRLERRLPARPEHDAHVDAAARDRILREVARTPTPGADGTAAWSLTLLRRALRAAPDGLPKVSTFTIWQVLRGAGYTFQRTRTWCPTGQAVRKRKAGVVTVTDPDAGAKKS